jgi:thiamine-phosphate pyrophosphorylase
MAESCILYYITDRSAFSGDQPTRRQRLLDKIAEAVEQGIDYIQLREKDLTARELEALGREAMKIIGKHSSAGHKARTALLVNSRTDVALVAGADGVHLRSDDVTPADVHAVWRTGADGSKQPLIGVSCHSATEVTRAAINGATFAVFAPVFEKRNAAPSGIDSLRDACRAPIPVLALGGVTVQNATSCLRTGAAGIAGIRLFQENDIASMVRAIRG